MLNFIIFSPKKKKKRLGKKCIVRHFEVNGGLMSQSSRLRTEAKHSVSIGCANPDLGFGKPWGGGGRDGGEKYGLKRSQTSSRV